MWQHSALSNCCVAVGRKWDCQHVLIPRDKNITKTHFAVIEKCFQWGEIKDTNPEGFAPDMWSRWHAVPSIAQAVLWMSCSSRHLPSSLLAPWRQASPKPRCFHHFHVRSCIIASLTFGSSRKWGNKSVSQFGCELFFIFWGRNLLSSFELFCMFFLACSAISPDGSWAMCFHSEGLSQTAGWGEHGLHLMRVSMSMHLPFSTAFPQQIWLGSANKLLLAQQELSCSPGWRKPP